MIVDLIVFGVAWVVCLEIFGWAVTLARVVIAMFTRRSR